MISNIIITYTIVGQAIIALSALTQGFIGKWLSTWGSLMSRGPNGGKLSELLYVYKKCQEIMHLPLQCCMG